MTACIVLINRRQKKNPQKNPPVVDLEVPKTLFLPAEFYALHMAVRVTDIGIDSEGGVFWKPEEGKGGAATLLTNPQMDRWIGGG